MEITQLSCSVVITQYPTSGKMIKPVQPDNNNGILPNYDLNRFLHIAVFVLNTADTEIILLIEHQHPK